MFKVGDRVELIEHDRESRVAELQLGDTGTILAIEDIVYINWDCEPIHQYHINKKNASFPPKKGWGVYQTSIDLIDTNKSPHYRVIRKIKSMETRWKTFQEKKYALS